MEKRFLIRPYSKRELAKLYFPNNRNPKTAVDNLRNMINRCKKLRQALDETGYQPTDKVFTPRQVDLIAQFVGEPYADG